MLFIDPAPPEIYTLSLHDALPICEGAGLRPGDRIAGGPGGAEGARPEDRCTPAGGVREGHQRPGLPAAARAVRRSEEHTSELQSLRHLVCRLLLEKKKKQAEKNAT